MIPYPSTKRAIGCIRNVISRVSIISSKCAGLFPLIVKIIAQQEIKIGQTARAVKIPIISRQSLRRLETYFIAPHIYQRPDVPDRQAKLASIVSTNIIPRLLRLHSEIITDAPPVKVLVEALAPSKVDVSGLADILLGADLKAAAAYITILRDCSPMGGLFVELLEPAARLLGEIWDRDECDFIDVTLGVARLQKLLAVFNNTHTVASLDNRHQVLIAMTPGEQHQFGLQIVERFSLGGGLASEDSDVRHDR